MQKTRYTHLDAIRGIAALSVVFYHFFVRSYEFDNLVSPYAGTPLAYGGEFGVGIFFILSGYLIPLSSRGRTAGTFLRGRVIRLFPTYWVAIILTTIVVTLAGQADLEVTLKQVLVNFTMTHFLFGIDSVDGVYWTLFLEWNFYFVVAIVLAVQPRATPTVAGLLSIGAGFLVWLSLSDYSPITLPSKVSHLLPYTLYFIAGFVVYLGRCRTDVMSVFKMVCIQALMVLALFDVIGVGRGLAALLATLVFLTFLYWKPQIPKQNLIVQIGLVSYPLYLVHQKIGYVLIRWLTELQLYWGLAVAIAFVVVLALSFLLHWFIEKPFSTTPRGQKK